MSDVKLVSARPDVEIQLPDGRVLSGPRGAQIRDFFNALEFDLPVVGAIINGELHELSYRLKMDSRAQPVTMDMPDGARIYRRSLTFLLEMAFADLFPEGKLNIDHSVASGGYYCHVVDHAPLTKSELSKLKKHMKDLVEADVPFERQEVPLKQAIEQFGKLGYDDKVHLLKYRK